MSRLLISLLSGEAMAVVGRARKSMVEYAIAAVAALIGFIFLLVAGFIYVADRYGELYAALYLGGGFLLLAVLVLIYHKLMTRLRIRRARRRMNAEAVSVAATLGVAALPLLLTRKGMMAGVALPAIAAAAYAIYRENSGDKGGDLDR